MSSSNPARLDSPDFCARSRDALLIQSGADGRADGDGLAHAQKDLNGRFGGVGRALQLLEDGVAFGRRRRRDLAVHDLVDVGFAHGRRLDVGGHHALAQIALQKRLCLGHRRRIEILRERVERGRLEHIDAKPALGGRR